VLFEWLSQSVSADKSLSDIIGSAEKEKTISGWVLIMKWNARGAAAIELW
jgi:hypothetical protein